MSGKWTKSEIEEFERRQEETGAFCERIIENDTMRDTLVTMLESRGITRYRLGQLIGIKDPTKMGWLYEVLRGHRRMNYGYLSKIVKGLAACRPFDEEESVQIVEALVEAHWEMKRRRLEAADRVRHLKEMTEEYS